MASQDETGGRPSKKPRLSFADEVEVLVGPNKKRFYLHKHIICSRSTFFEAAFAERWTKDSRTIELPEDDPDIFDVYLHSVYNNRVDVGSTDETLDGETDHPQPDFRITNRLARACILADKLGDPVTANLLIDGIIDNSDTSNAIPGLNTVAMIVNYTLPAAPLRRLMIDYYAHEAGESCFTDDKYGDIVPWEFFMQVLAEVAKSTQAQPDETVRTIFKLDYVSSHRSRYYHRVEDNAISADACEKGKTGVEK